MVPGSSVPSRTRRYGHEKGGGRNTSQRARPPFAVIPLTPEQRPGIVPKRSALPPRFLSRALRPFRKKTPHAPVRRVPSCPARPPGLSETRSAASERCPSQQGVPPAGLRHERFLPAVLSDSVFRYRVSCRTAQERMGRSVMTSPSRTRPRRSGESDSCLPSGRSSASPAWA